MDDNSKQWITMGPPATPAEERALSDVRKLLPDVNTTCAWSNLTFVAHGGQSSEVDVILLNHNGLFVLELKGWHGRITGDQQNWRVTDPNGKVRTAPNPLHSTRLKAQRLKGLLEKPWQRQWGEPDLPVFRVWRCGHDPPGAGSREPGAGIAQATGIGHANEPLPRAGARASG